MRTLRKDVGKHSRTKTKAAEVEHAIRHHLDVELDDDPDLQASFAQALAAIFEEFRDNWNKIYEELEKLRAPHHQRRQGADLWASPQEADAAVPHVPARAVRGIGEVRGRSGAWRWPNPHVRHE